MKSDVDGEGEGEGFVEFECDLGKGGGWMC